MVLKLFMFCPFKMSNRSSTFLTAFALYLSGLFMPLEAGQGQKLNTFKQKKI